MRRALRFPSPGSLNIGQGTSGTTYVTVNPQYGFTGNVTLSVSGLPSGVTALWNPNPTTGTSMLTLTASQFRRSGYEDADDHRHLGQSDRNHDPESWRFMRRALHFRPGESEHWPGNLRTAYVYVNPQYGFTGNVNLSVSGLPSGVTASFSPNPTTGFTIADPGGKQFCPAGYEDADHHRHLGQSDRNHNPDSCCLCTHLHCSPVTA